MRESDSQSLTDGELYCGQWDHEGDARQESAALQDVKAGDRAVVHPMKHNDQLMAMEIVFATPATKTTTKTP